MSDFITVEEAKKIAIEIWKHEFNEEAKTALMNQESKIDKKMKQIEKIKKEVNEASCEMIADQIEWTARIEKKILHAEKAVNRTSKIEQSIRDSAIDIKNIYRELKTKERHK